MLSPRVPKMTTSQLQPTFTDLIASVPELPSSYQVPADFDWAMHPGGATILTGAERALGITPEHMRASYDTYINHGNSSSATIFSVLDRLRDKDMDAYAPGGQPKEYIIGCAFGPGIAVESCVLKRNMGAAGIDTPPETASEASRSEAGDAVEEAPAASAEVAEAPARQPPGPTRPEGAHYEQFISSELDNLELD